MSGVDFKVDRDHSTRFGLLQNRSEEGGTDAARACSRQDVEFFERANETAVFRAEKGGGIGDADDLGIVASYEEESDIGIGDDFLEDWQQLIHRNGHVMFGELSNEKFCAGGTIRMSSISNGDVRRGHILDDRSALD